MAQFIDERRDDDCRCPYGKLLARLTKTEVEVQCRRCKLLHIIPFTTKEQTAVVLRKPDCPLSAKTS